MKIHTRPWLRIAWPIAAVLCQTSMIASAQSAIALKAAVAEYVRSEMQRQNIPGVALLVSRGGKIVQAEGFGLANVELQVPVKPGTDIAKSAMAGLGRDSRLLSLATSMIS